MAITIASQPNDIDDGIPTDDCDKRVLSRTPSVDREWDAVVEQAMCPVGFAGWVLIIDVGLYRKDSPFRERELLNVTTSGHQDEWPQVDWTAPRALHVYVPSAAYLKINACRVEDVTADVEFTPVNLNDWRRAMGMKLEPDKPAPRCPEAPPS